MQLRVMMYIKSKKSAVFVLRVIYTYKQSLNELQKHMTLLVDFGTNNIYFFATQPWVVVNNDIFQ